MTEPVLTEFQAYNAMLEFLEAYWERGGRTSDDLASMLSGMQLFDDGSTYDPAQWDDWKRAVSAVLSVEE
ncbi:MAG: hypothetical protein IOB84_00255 [Brevundimonas sp.]|nr:hypothetical protein [Brevundimonas sp.]